MKKIVTVLCLIVACMCILVSCKKEYSGYSIGDIGPAGGYIFYDKGYYSDGWRYLEAAPADLRVIDGVPTVDVNTPGYDSDLRHNGYFSLGYYVKDKNSLGKLIEFSFGGVIYDYPNRDVFLFVNGKTEYDEKTCTGTGIGTGKKNTQLLVKAMGNNAVIRDSSAESGLKTSGEYAAKLCDDLKYKNNGRTYSDWFLPSIDELNLMFTNLNADGIGGNATGSYFLSSSEVSDDATRVWVQNIYETGFRDTYSRHAAIRVRPVRSF